MNKLWFAALGIIVVVAVGCRSTARPNWFHPGPVEYQQSQAQQFDPYPETHAGPTIVGGRPLEYDKPPAEVLRVQPPLSQSRSRWLPWNWGRQ